MQKLRMILGLAALLSLTIAVNLMVLQQSGLNFVAWALLGVGLLLGGLWVVLVLLSLIGSAGWEGWAAGGVNAALSTLFFLGISIVLYVFMAGWNASWDLTQEGRRTLAPQTVQVLQNMNQEVEVFCFFLNIDDELVWIARDKTLRFLSQCEGYSDLLKVEVLDPQVEKHRVDAFNLTHASTQGTIVIRAGGRQRVITLSGGSPRLEERDFTNALINVLRATEPTVYFLTGHSERDVTDDSPQGGGSALANLLLKESYNVAQLGIKISDPEIPAECDILVINNPVGDLRPQEIKALDAFVDRGGRLLVLLEPWKSVTTLAGQSEQLRPWLADRFGIDVRSDIVLSKADKLNVQLELRNDDSPFPENDDDFMTFKGSFNGEHAITQGFDQVMLLSFVRTIGRTKKLPENVAASIILRSTPEFWAETDLVALNEKGEASQHEEELAGPLPLAVAAVRRADGLDETGQPITSRIVVVGDSDFAANGRLDLGELPGHLNFVLNTMAWLTERQDLIAIRPTGKTDPPLVLSAGEKRAIVWISTLMTVQLVIAAGLVVFVLRRKYR